MYGIIHFYHKDGRVGRGGRLTLELPQLCRKLNFRLGHFVGLGENISLGTKYICFKLGYCWENGQGVLLRTKISNENLHKVSG